MRGRSLLAPAVVAIILLAVLAPALTYPQALASSPSGAEAPALGICRYPEPYVGGRDTPRDIPTYNPSLTEAFQVDLRGRDLSGYTASELPMRSLLWADFDDRTKWPAELPPGFDPGLFMKLGKNPGLELDLLHRAGITGRGVSVAIIDQTLLVDHQEYADRVRCYEECSLEPFAAMHGAAVASILVGRTVGVAPGADLYYVQALGGSLDYLAQAIDRVVEISRSLPAERRIRVLSISAGFSLDGGEHYDEVMAAAQQAQANGIFVISSSIAGQYGLQFNGLGRDPRADPDDPNSYGPGSWWAQAAYEAEASLGTSNHSGVANIDLLAPMDSRCTASPTGTSDYVFYRTGGWSWSIPYIAGLYALACQVDPGIKPERFWQAALQTGKPLILTNTYGLGTDHGRIVLPVPLIERLAGRDVVPGRHLRAGNTSGSTQVTPWSVLAAVAPIAGFLAALGLGGSLLRRARKHTKAPPFAGRAK